MQTRRAFLRATGAGGAAAVLPGSIGVRGAAADRRPNFVIIMTDDMGFSDPGCYGGEIATPNIDALARGGLRFTEFYNCSRCCPTRASIMTGMYPHQVNLFRNGRSLSTKHVTVAEALKQAGYRTAMTGKWHLSHTPRLKGKRHMAWLNHRLDPGRPFGPIETYPVNRGFDRHYGVIWGVVDYFDPFSLVDGTDAVKDVPDDYYLTDAITDRSVRYIREMSRSAAPFFLYVAHCAPHWPLHARPEDIEKYRGRYDGGWQKLRRDRYRRQVAMGLFDEKTAPLPPLEERGPDWDGFDDDGRRFQAAKMAVHAAMVDRVDKGIEKIVAALKACGRLENTVIMFLSDNGASPETPRDWGPGYDRPSHTRDGRQIRYTGFQNPGPQTTCAGIGVRWANAANTPFRYWKKESYEGGCHTPFVVHWPAGLKTAAGSTTAQLGHVMDIFPTCLDLAGAPYPETFNGAPQPGPAGRSLAPVFAGRQREAPDRLFFEHAGGRAVRHGRWKLVALPKKPWRLYDLETDRTETTDLAAKHPARVADMEEQWTRWARRCGVPWVKQGDT